MENLTHIQRIVMRLPEKLNQEIMRKSQEFMRFVLKYARAKAPKDSTYLANALNVYTRGKSIILSTGDAYYANFVEFGSAPHVVPIEYLEQHSRISGMPVFKPRAFVRLSGKAQPFLYPAFEDALSQLPNMLTNAALSAIRESK